jgi:signal transduction histidine kinase
VSTTGWNRWWSRRSLRARVTVLATATLAFGLTLGTVLFAMLFARGQIADLDSQLRSEVATVSGLVQGNQLPKPLPVPDGGTVFAQVVDHAGTVLASSQNAPQVLSILSPDQLASWPSGTARSVSASTAVGRPLRILTQRASWNGHPTTVIAAAPSGQITSTLTALRRVLIVGVPLVVLAGALATWLAVGSALRPVDDLRATAERIGRGEPQPGPDRLPVPPSSDEIARLAVTLNSMLVRLDESAAHQRRFTADAAHELRSPLASMITQLEVAISYPGTDWPELARDVLTDARRLSALAEDLLLLARIEADRGRRADVPGALTGAVETASPASGDAAFAPSARPDGPVGLRSRGLAEAGEAVDLVDVAESFAQPELRDGQSGGVPVTVLTGGRGVLVAGDADALSRVVRNLVDNAVRYARTSVVVAVSAEPDDGLAVLRVDDDGPGIDEADLERVFDRFTRLDPARARTATAGVGARAVEPGERVETNGSGLGLDIARSIARAYGGDVVAGRSALGGASFALTLPVTPGEPVTPVNPES